MNRGVLAVAKLNLRTAKPAYFVGGVLIGISLLEVAVDAILLHYGIHVNQTACSTPPGGTACDQITSYTVSPAWYLWLGIAVAAVIIASRNFVRIINLGGRRANYFWGSLAANGALAAGAALLVTIIYYVVDVPMNRYQLLGGMWGPPNVFGWANHGPVVVFLQQFAFLALFAAFVHTLTAAQKHWYGWLAAAVIIAIISVFTPITPLRHAEAWFFHLILFGNPALQIVSCLVLAGAIYALNKPILARTPV